MVSSWEGRLSRDSGSGFSAGIYMEADPYDGVGDGSFEKLCLTLKSSYFSAGVPTLEGFYDLAESGKIPGSAFFLERGVFSLERKSSLSGRYGAALHTTNENVLFHMLRRKDYAQAGLLFQSGESSPFQLKTSCLYTWDEYAPEEDDEPWSELKDGRTGEPLIHGMAEIGYEMERSSGLWNMAAAGQFLYSPLLLPGYAGYLFMGCRGEFWAINLSWQDSGGYLRDCRGEGIDWVRGAAWEGKIGGDGLGLYSRGTLYQPGYFSVGAGIDPRQISPAGEGRISIEGGRFLCFYEMRENSWKDLSDAKGGAALRFRTDRLSGTARWERREGYDSWFRRVTGLVEWKDDSLAVKGEGNLLWERKTAGPPSDQEWEIDVRWGGFPPGKISLSLGGKGKLFSGPEGDYYGELTFESVGF